jgi:hypothetical protein
MQDSIYDRIWQYISSHNENNWLKDYPLIFFKKDHFKFAKECIIDILNIKEENIIVYKDENIKSDSYHFPYYCGEFSDKIKEHSEDRIKENDQWVKAGYCSQLCSCDYSHSNWVYEDNFFEDSCDNIYLKYYGNRIGSETIQNYVERLQIPIYSPYTYLNYFWGESDNDNVELKNKTCCWNKCCTKTKIKKRYLIKIL